MIPWIVTSSILIVIVAALRFLLRGKLSLRLQYALWGLVLLRLLVPVSFGNFRWSAANASTLFAPVESAVTSSSLALPGGSMREFAGIEDYEVYIEENRTHGISGAANPDFREIGSGANYFWAIVPITVPWTGILSGLWLSGAAVMALWLLISNLRFAIRLRRSRRALD